MDDVARRQQLLGEQIQHARKELQRPQPPYRFEFSCIGCFIGGLLGPVFLTGLFFLDMLLQPNAPVGGPLGYLILLIASVPLGGGCCAILGPLLYQLFRTLLHPPGGGHQ